MRVKMRYASFGKRFLVSLLDGIIMGVANLVVGFGLGIVMGGAGASEQEAFVMGGLLGLLLSWVYSAAMESSSQRATFGKRALGLTVTDLNGNQLSFGAASGRYFGKFISSAICLIGYLMAAFTDKRQALHDMMAGSLVLED